MRIIILFLSFTMLSMTIPSTESNIRKTFVKLSTAELELYNLIMEYRKTYNLPAIPLSKSLTYVAQQHAIDFETNNPETKFCNLHSWSNQGKWKGCCYKDDHSNTTCMVNKPKELTNYKFDGYEISCSVSKPYTMSPEKSLKLWKGSRYHNDVIINKGEWRSVSWSAIGIGMHNGYACVWFGETLDKDGEPNLSDQ
jgi:hypothetical protein